jgi:hypothetical protein
MCLAVTAMANAATYTVNLWQTATLNGKELKAGEYKVELNANKARITRGKESVEADVKVENSDQKYSNTSVQYSNGNGKYELREIRLGGTKTRILFN